MADTRVKFEAPGLPQYGGSSLEDFIAALTKVLHQAEPEHRSLVTIDFSTYDSYGSSEPTCEIELLRAATPEELQAQKDEQARRARNDIAIAERTVREAQARLAKLAGQ